MDPGRGRALEEPGGKLSQCFGASRGPHLNRAVRQISDASSQPESLSLPYNPPPISHALYSAADAEVASCLVHLVQAGHLLMFAPQGNDQPGMPSKGRATV